MKVSKYTLTELLRTVTESRYANADDNKKSKYGVNFHNFVSVVLLIFQSCVVTETWPPLQTYTYTTHCISKPSRQTATRRLWSHEHMYCKHNHDTQQIHKQMTYVNTDTHDTEPGENRRVHILCFIEKGELAGTMTSHFLTSLVRRVVLPRHDPQQSGDWLVTYWLASDVMRQEGWDWLCLVSKSSDVTA